MSLTFIYNYPNQGEATVTGHTDRDNVAIVVIPSTVVNGVTTYNVTSIGEKAFDGYSALESVTIGDSVQTIGAYAFYDCIALESVTIGDSVTSIGNEAFYLCTALESVTIGDSVTSIGNEAFYLCTALDSVTIGDSVTSIGNNAFEGCETLQSVTIGNSVQTIGDRVFASCSALPNLAIGNSVTSIGSYAFYDCIALESVTFKHTGVQASNITFGTTVFQNINTNVDLVLYDNSVTLDGGLYNVGDTNVTLSGGTFVNVSLFNNVCFPHGTVLSLDQGDVEIQNVDTKKHTLNGKPILFVTKTAPNKPDVVCFEKDAFAPNVPSQRFECSRAHGIEFDGVRKMAEDWVDADQIHFVPNTHKFLYCLLLETHEMMDVYNIKAETLNPVRKVAQMYFAQLKKEKESC